MLNGYQEYILEKRKRFIKKVVKRINKENNTKIVFNHKKNGFLIQDEVIYLWMPNADDKEDGDFSIKEWYYGYNHIWINSSYEFDKLSGCEFKELIDEREDFLVEFISKLYHTYSTYKDCFLFQNKECKFNIEANRYDWQY